MIEPGEADLSRATKAIDAWWTVLIIDPIAVRILPALIEVDWITPNLVTGAAFVVGAGAIALFALGHFVVGAILYELRFLLDCLDGKIARVRRIASPLGAAFDRTADSISVPAAYAALGLSLAGRHGLGPAWALVPALMSCFVTVTELSLELLRSKSPGAAEGPAPASGRGLRAFLGRHRLRLLPWTVEAEAVGLFLAPLVLRHHALGMAELAIAAAYGAFAIVDLAEMVGAAKGR